MLKLERLSTNSHVNIRLKENSFFFDAPFLRALGYSLLFHIVLFGFFKIEFLDISEPIDSPAPVSVALGETNQPVATTKVDVDTPFDKPLFVASGIDKIEMPTEPMNATEFMLSQVHHNVQNNALWYEKSEDYASFAKEMSEPLQFQERLYPLRLKFSSSLSKLKLIEDGSSLFKEKSPHHSVSSYILTVHPLDIEYDVVVSGESGKVIEWKRKELLDKRLQRYADFIIKTISFAPSEKLCVQGKILLIFKCSGEEIEHLVLKRLHV